MSRRTSFHPPRRLPRHPCLAAFVLAALLPGPRPAFAAAAPPACPPLTENPTGITPGCGCVMGSGPIADSGDWGRGNASGEVTTRALPGRICHMNIGNSGAEDGGTIDSCLHLLDRAGELGNMDCDAISVMELMSDAQCARHCTSNPDGEKCAVCKGCGVGTGAT